MVLNPVLAREITEIAKKSLKHRCINLILFLSKILPLFGSRQWEIALEVISSF